MPRLTQISGEMLHTKTAIKGSVKLQSIYCSLNQENSNYPTRIIDKNVNSEVTGDSRYFEKKLPQFYNLPSKREFAVLQWVKCKVVLFVAISAYVMILCFT